MKFIFQSSWIDLISDLPTEIQDKIIADIIRVKLNKEQAHQSDPAVSIALSILSSEIQSLDTKLDRDVAIYNLAQQGFKASEIAERLDLGVSTVQHSEGWRNRNSDNLSWI